MNPYATGHLYESDLFNPLITNRLITDFKDSIYKLARKGSSLPSKIGKVSLRALKGLGDASIVTNGFWASRETLAITNSLLPRSSTVVKELQISSLFSSFTVCLFSLMSGPLDIVTAPHEIKKAYQLRQINALLQGCLKFLQGWVTTGIGINYLFLKPILLVLTLKGLSVNHIKNSSFLAQITQGLSTSLNIFFTASYVILFFSSLLQLSELSFFVYDLDETKTREHLISLEKEADVSKEQSLKTAKAYLKKTHIENVSEEDLVTLGKAIERRKIYLKEGGKEFFELCQRLNINSKSLQSTEENLDLTQITSFLKAEKMKEMISPAIMGSLSLLGILAMMLIFTLGSASFISIVAPAIFLIILVPTIGLEVWKLRRDIHHKNVSEKHNEKLLLLTTIFTLLLIGVSLIFSLHFGLSFINMSLTLTGGSATLLFYVYSYLNIRKARKGEYLIWQEYIKEVLRKEKMKNITLAAQKDQANAFSPTIAPVVQEA